MKTGTTAISLARLAAFAAERKTGVRTHSGNVSPGDVFVSLPRALPVGPAGPDFSGAEAFLLDAVRAGAAYVVCAQTVWDAAAPALDGVLQGPLGVAVVPDARVALGVLANAVYGTDQAKTRLYGVTGTNGKTTSTYLLEAVLRAAGRAPGIIGTVEYRWPGHKEPSPLTTPDTMALHSMVAAMGKAGAEAAVMEVSSHAIEQNRMAGLTFSGALFTNLTQDHLDYHRTMEEYFAVKSRFFKSVARGGFMPPDAAVAVNVDDPYGARIFADAPGALGYGFARQERNSLHGEIVEQSRDGLLLRMRFAGKTWDLRSPLVGEFNAYNLLGVQALALALGLAPDCAQALAAVGGVPGRLERVPDKNGLAVFVDYAHTPDALQKALLALRGAGFARVIVVFGCGGDRDRSKRPRMGEAAAAFADFVVLTSDNPRGEDPAAIMDDVRPGLAKAAAAAEEVDRRKAIGMALDAARPGDAVLVAGKGHESSQIIGDAEHPFSDQQVIRDFLGCA